jgi:hypothetical protein
MVFVVDISGSIGGGHPDGLRPDFKTYGRALPARKTTIGRVKNLEALPKKRAFPQLSGRK